MRRATGLVALALAGCSSHEPSAAREGRRESFVVGGTLDAGDDAAVALGRGPAACGEPEPISAACTGVLIAPRVVLTAGHCLEQPPTRVSFGPSVVAPTAKLGVRRVARHPKYDKTTSDFDLGLVWLDGDASATPLALGGAPPAVGAPMRVVGFGKTLSAAEPEGVKREGKVVLTAVAARTLAYGPMPGMTCVGDSGGPVLDASGALVGITSAGDSKCLTQGVATRTDVAAMEWVTAALAAPAGDDGVGLDCARTCAKDADCRPGLLCKDARDGAKRCALEVYEPGQLGVACTSSATCASHVCAADASGCRCYDTCGDAPTPEVDAGPDPKKADAGDVTDPELVGGGGCRVGGQGSGLSLWLVAVSLCLRSRRARR